MNAADALRELSEPWPSGSYVKEAIGRAARSSGLSYTRCSDIWYRKARRIEASEAEAIAAALQKKRELEAKNELHDLKVRLARLEARLASTDSDFHRPTIDWLGKMACRSS